MYFQDSLEGIYNKLSVSCLPDGWYCSSVINDEIQCFQTTRQPPNLPPVIISRLLLIQRDLTWKVYVSDHLVSMNNEILAQYDSIISSEVILPLIHSLNDAFLCPGNFESHIIQLAHNRRGNFQSQQGQLIAILEKNVLFNIDGEHYSATVRHVQCEILMSSLTVCCTCQRYRNTLRAMASRAAKQLSHELKLHANVRYLRTPQRSAYIKSLQIAIRTKNQQVKRMKLKLNRLMESHNCIKIDDNLTSDITQVIENTQLLQGDEFKRIFWEQQVD